MSIDNFIQENGTSLRAKTYKKQAGNGSVSSCSVNSLLLAGLLSLNACGDGHNADNVKNQASIAGVGLKAGITGSDGNKSFTDDHSGSSINVHVSDQNGGSLPKVDVLFADGFDFGMFILNREGYEPQLYPVSDGSASNGVKSQPNNHKSSHNSNYDLSLTSSPLLFNRYDIDDTDYEGAKNSFGWSERWPSTGCYNKEELGVVMKSGAYLVKKGSSYLTSGASDIFIDDLSKNLKGQVGEDEIVVMHSFIPSKYGIYGLTTITSLEIKKGSCDSYQEPEKPDDYQCQDTVFCDHFDGSLDKWNVKGSAAIDNGWLRMDGANIINKNNIDFTQCSSAEIQYQARVEGNYGLYLGNEIALYGDGDNGDLQFVCSSEGKSININLNSNHQVKVQLGNTLSVNGDSIPCNNLPEYVNFSAGSISTLNLDYVKVKCVDK